MNIVKENRIGSFKVTHDLIEKGGDGLLEFFGNFIIIRAESRIDYRAVEYIGYSWMFDENPKDCMTPEYTIKVNKTPSKDGFDYTFTAEKKVY